MTPKRDPDQTRKTLLEAAFREIYQQGFQAASLDEILQGTGVTKGALYHHFPNKAALGQAVIEEVIRDEILERWLYPLQRHENPIDGLMAVFEAEMEDIPPEVIAQGCPLNNLAQEMSAVDEGFRTSITRIFNQWRNGIAAALQRGIEAGLVRGDVNPEHVAAFIVASIEGIAGTAKNTRDAELTRSMGTVLVGFIETLRVAPEAGDESSAQSERGARVA